MRLTRGFPTTILATVLLMTACASSGTTGGEEQAGAAAANGVAVTVNNDLVPPATITVWMVPESGGRRRLGTVTPNGRQTFSFSPGVRSMNHRLVAEPTGGSDHTSNPFDLVAVTTVQWRVSTPNVTIERGND